MRVYLPPGFGLGPPLNPDRACRCPCGEARGRRRWCRCLGRWTRRPRRTLVGRWACRGRRRCRRCRHFLGLDAQNPHGGAVGADEARFEVFLDVGDRRFLVEIAVALLAFGQVLFKTQPRQLGHGPGREDPKDEQIPRLFRHRLRIEDAKVAEILAIGRNQRHAQVAFDPHLRQRKVGRESLGHADRIMAQTSSCHVLTRRSGQVVFEVRDDVCRPASRQGRELSWR